MFSVCTFVLALKPQTTDVQYFQYSALTLQFYIQSHDQKGVNCHPHESVA